jgi:hypothetical protein
MKTSITSTLILVAVFLASPILCRAQQTDPTKEIEKVIGDFFSALSARDASAVRNVLGKQFVAMDVVTQAGKKNSRIEFLDTSDDEKVLPPKENNDMAGLRVSSLKAEFSDSNPTVAIASFVASRPLTEKQLEAFTKSLAIDPRTFRDNSAVDPAVYEAQRARIEKWVCEKQIQFSMLAMLGRQNGKWKIVCMSFPE